MRPKSQRTGLRWLRNIALTLSSLSLVALLTACGGGEKPNIAVFTIDRTGVAKTPTWADEVSVIAKAEVGREPFKP